MIIAYSELEDSVLKAMGLTRANADPVIITDIRNRVNAIQDWIALKEDWEWRSRSYHITTKAPYETGTITLTQGSRAVTGSGTTWTKGMEMGYLLHNSRLYRVKTFNSTTSLTLDSAFPNDTVAGASYKIVYPFYFMHPDVSSLVAVKHEGRELSVKNKERLILSSAGIAQPKEAFISDRMDKTFDNTGTVTMAASTSVVGSGTAFIQDMEGMPFQVDEFGEVYVVDTVTDSTHLTLNKAYRGDVGAGKAYTIGKEGSLLIGFKNIPDDYYYLTLETLVFPTKLVSATDYSMIPNHAPLLHGCMYYAYTQATQKDPVRIQQELANFRESMDQLKSSYKVISNSRWTSECEIASRSNGGYSSFDPLNLRHDRF